MMMRSFPLLYYMSVSVGVTSSVDHLLTVSLSGILYCKDRCEQYGACKALLYNHLHVRCQLITSIDGTTTDGGYEYISRNGTDRNLLPTERSVIARNQRISFTSNCLVPAMMVGSVVKDEQSRVSRTCSSIGVWTTRNSTVSGPKVSVTYTTGPYSFYGFVLTLSSGAMRKQMTQPLSCLNGPAAAWDRIVNKAYLICVQGHLRIMNFTGDINFYGQGIIGTYWWLGLETGECVFYAGGRGDNTAREGSIYRMSVFTGDHQELLSGIHHSTLIALYRAKRRVYFIRDGYMDWVSYGGTSSGREQWLPLPRSLSFAGMSACWSVELGEGMSNITVSGPNIQRSYVYKIPKADVLMVDTYVIVSSPKRRRVYVGDLLTGEPVVNASLPHGSVENVRVFAL